MRPDEMIETPEWSRAAKWAWGVVGGLVCVFFGMALAYRLIPQPGVLHDYVQEWASGRNYFGGYPIFEPLATAVPRHIPGRYFGIVQVNAHPPASVLASLPFARVSYGASYLAWNLASLGALGFSLWLMMRRKGLAYSAWALLPIGSLLLTSNSLAQQVNQGQWNLFLVAMITSAWCADRHGRLATAGALIGVAAAFKIFPAYLALYFVMRRKWNAVGACVIAFLAANVLTGVILGWQSYIDYVQVVLPQVGAYRDWWPNASVAGFFAKLFHAPSGHVEALIDAPALASGGFIFVGLVMTGIVAYQTWRSNSAADEDRAWSLAIIAMLLLSPITWDHYFLMLLLPLLILWRGLPATWANRSCLVGAAIGLMVINPHWIWDATIPGNGELPRDPNLTPSVATPLQVITVISYQFYLLIALFVFALLSRVRPEAAGEACASAKHADLKPAE